MATIFWSTRRQWGTLGGKVKTISVLRTAPFRPFAKPPTQDETRQKLKRVWQGKFQQFACQIDWAEGTFWSIEAVVEFGDGKRSPVVTGGVHVALQDHNGNSASFACSRLFSSTAAMALDGLREQESVRDVHSPRDGIAKRLLDSAKRGLLTYLFEGR